MWIITIRSIEETDWKQIYQLLSRELSKKAVKRKISYLRHSNKSGYNIIIGSLDFNIVGFLVKKNNKILERFILEDCKRLVPHNFF